MAVTPCPCSRLEGYRNYGKRRAAGQSGADRQDHDGGLQGDAKALPLDWGCAGKGAMVAFELVKDRASKEPAPEAAKIITQECYQKGLIAISAGIYSNVMRFLPPLVITRAA